MGMTDRELLEAAADACGYKWSNDVAKERESRGLIGLWISDVSTYWHPLNSGGDALRLAVKLGLLHEHPKFLRNLALQMQNRAITGLDECEATRRAIVITAAEIQKQKNGL